MKENQTQLLRASGVEITTPPGRLLFRGLSMAMGYEKVAIIGRNGVGKSTLLRVLAGERKPKRGRIRHEGLVWHVPQHLEDAQVQACIRRLLEASRSHHVGVLDVSGAYAAGLLSSAKDAQPSGATERSRTEASSLIAAACEALGLPPLTSLAASAGLSRGQQRKLALLDAWLQQPALLLLDEPTEALDAQGRTWLLRLLHHWSRGLIVVSHDQELLRQFSDFFVLAESGGRYFQGSFEALQEELLEEHAEKEKEYARNLRVLADKEWHNARVCRRRARKKNLGRIHETGRAPSRALLNTNRSYAQMSQGRAAKIRKQRREATRAWAKSTRRALDVQLDLAPGMPVLPPADGTPNIVLQHVTHRTQEGFVLFSDLSVEITRERWAIQGPNGAGKTTLLRLMLGELEPQQGKSSCRFARIGWIAQDATNWILPESLLSLLSTARGIDSLDEVAALLVSHKFPLALAERPLSSLSPGERLRAALLCLFMREDPVECLVLDEPTYSLDFVGLHALTQSLKQWPGGLVIASHDQTFLQQVDCTQSISLSKKEKQAESNM